MRIAVPREIKNHEYRVGLTPAGVRELCQHGHEVAVQVGAGSAIGFADAQYQSAGARLQPNVAELFADADLVVKVKEPQPEEYGYFRPGQFLFTYLHLAADRRLCEALLRSGVTAIGYETVRDGAGTLPLLAPMSEIAGRLAVQAGAHALECAQGGVGVLLGGVAGVLPARVTVLGGGVVGSNAARIALGMGADVTLLDSALTRLRQLDSLYGPALKTLFATEETVEQSVLRADLVIGAVLIPGATAPRLVSRALVERMQPGSVLVDVAIDQGGCFETSRPTTHAEPIYREAGVVHYCVANMPGAVARTSTLALTQATLPYVLALADRGLAALQADTGFAAGVNLHRGQVVCEAVAHSLDYRYQPFSALI